VDDSSSEVGINNFRKGRELDELLTVFQCLNFGSLENVIKLI